MSRSFRDEAELLARLANTYFRAVPEKYRTFCALTSRVTQRVLSEFGVACEVVPCQVWHGSQRGLIAVGFLGKKTPNKWDGHAACMTATHVIDASLHQIQREFGAQVPDVVVANRIPVPSQFIASAMIEPQTWLYWINPPDPVHAQVVEEPPELVETLASDLTRALTAD